MSSFLKPIFKLLVDTGYRWGEGGGHLSSPPSTCSTFQRNRTELSWRLIPNFAVGNLGLRVLQRRGLELGLEQLSEVNNKILKRSLGFCIFLIYSKCFRCLHQNGDKFLNKIPYFKCKISINFYLLILFLLKVFQSLTSRKNFHTSKVTLSIRTIKT